MRFLGQQTVSLRQPRISVATEGGLKQPFARFLDASEGLLGQHQLVFHPSTCESPNADNHDILNAYLCNVIQGPEVFKNTSTFRPMQTSLLGAWGAWSLLVGPQVCEYGDCGSITNTNEVAAGSLVKVMGHLKVEVYGDLPAEVEADVAVQQVATAQDPTTYPVQKLGQSAILHPENPGTYTVLMGTMEVEGVTYIPHLEQRFETGWISSPESRVEVLNIAS